MDDEKYKCPECYREAGRQHATTCKLIGMVLEDDDDQPKEIAPECLQCGEPIRGEHKTDCLHAGTVRPYDCTYNEEDRFTLTHPFHQKKEDQLTKTQELIKETCSELAEFLIEKNRKYGDSVVTPVKVFSKAEPRERVNVRIDDKLSRIISGQSDDLEDTEIDLLGYLILRRVIKKNEEKS